MQLDDAAPARRRLSATGVGSAAGDSADHDDPAGGESVTAAAGAPPVPEPAAQMGVELQVGLFTLLGRDHHPGEIPGWGPIGADLARAIATVQRGIPWCFAVTDDTGQLVFAGVKRFRTSLFDLRRRWPGDACPARRAGMGVDWDGQR